MENSNDRRGASRFQTLNFLAYVERDDDGKIVSQGMAKTLDISASGALVKVPQKFSEIENVEFEIALEEDFFKVIPNIVSQEMNDDGSYNVRIQFKELKAADRHRMAKFLISIHNHHNH